MRMAILLQQDTPVLVQGITGHTGRFHTVQMLEYGTRVVAGVTPGKGGERVHGVRVFDSVREAVRVTGAVAAEVMVPAPHVLDAVLEDLEEGIELVHVLSEGVPQHDTLKMVRLAKSYGAVLVGPNSPGIASPPGVKMGIIPNMVLSPGRVGVVSRSGTLTYEILHHLTASGIGQCSAVGVGGDPIVGLTMEETVELLLEDSQCAAVVLVGEVGGRDEIRAARLRDELPMVAYIAGRVAKPGRSMGHAGAILKEGESALEKIEVLKEMGVRVAETPWEVPSLVGEVMGE